MNESLSSLYADHLRQRQAELEQALDSSGYDLLVLHSGIPKMAFQDDREYHFQPNPQFVAWAPLSANPHCLLVAAPGVRPVLHYYQPEDYWYTPPTDPERWWAQSFEIHSCAKPPTLESLRLSGRVAVIGELDAAELPPGWDLNPQLLVNTLQLQRTCKTDYEIECVFQANRLAAKGHRAAAQVFSQGHSEFQIHLAYCLASEHTDPELPYNSIVALNRNGATLHYQNKETTPPLPSRSFLIDAGASFHGYAADITRTYAAEPGEFQELIQAMDEIQLGLAEAAVAGVDYRDLHLLAHARIAALLHESGVIKASAESAVESGLSGYFLPHGLGHYLGLQVHDVAGLIANDTAEPIPRPEGHPFLRLTRVLEAGNVLTIEPGFYFIEPLLKGLKNSSLSAEVSWPRIEALMPYGGIRIEDNIVVGEGSSRNLTREAFA